MPVTLRARSKMQRRSRFASSYLTVVGACACLMVISGCSRQFWRRQAERDTYEAVRDKLNDPHWAVPRIDLTPDPRSRFFDPWDPDHEPLPPDDPAAHRMMHCVSGRKGYKNWHKLGTALSIENPHWLSSYGVLMENADPVYGHDQVTLEDITLQQAVDLNYIHNREYQDFIEDLYLTALVVTEQQFNLGVRYAGPGVRVPGFDATATDSPGGNNTFALDPRIGMAQLLPAGGQLAVELANNTLWLFGGGTSSSATSLAFSLTQPLLFRAGRKVVLESLTQAERNVLYSARDLARFRQRLFAGTATEFLLIQRQLQAIRNIEGNIRRVEKQIKVQQAKDRKPRVVIRWELSEMPDGVEIPPSLAGKLRYDDDAKLLEWNGTMTELQRDEILALSDDPNYQAAAAQLIVLRYQEVRNLTYAQLVTRLNGLQSRREQARVELADSTDRFKISLGLPPNVGMALDDSLLNQFTLIDPQLLELEQEFENLAEQQGPLVLLEEEVGEPGAILELLPDIRSYADTLSDFKSQVEGLLLFVEAEFEPVDLLLESTGLDSEATESAFGQRVFQTEEERERVRTDVDADRKLFALTRQDFRRSAGLLEMLVGVLSDENCPEALDSNQNGLIDPEEFPAGWLEIRRDQRRNDQPRTFDEAVREARNGVMDLREELVAYLQSLQVVQASLRVEQISVNQFALPGENEFPSLEEVTRIALNRRHDLMNARAEVMDARRLVEVAASELEATLDVTFSGEIGTAAGSRQPFNFSDSGAEYNAGLTLDSPADKVAERNDYNATLIAYQRARRAYMEFEDGVKQDVRESYRQLQVSELRLEIDRKGVRAAGLQLDIAATEAGGPNQDDALVLLAALDAVLTAQDALINDWITYEINRLNIYRDMGIMQIDEQGLWVDDFYTDVTVVDPEAPVINELAPPPILPSSAADSPASAVLPVPDATTGDGEQE